MTTLTVLATGPLATFQDLGRHGYAHLGVPASGGADRGSLTLANRLVGNDESAATIETTLGGLRIRVEGDVLAVVTGADTSVRHNGVPVGLAATVVLREGDELAVDPPVWGLRNYLAVRGGFDVEPVLGSRSTDTLSGLGPPVLTANVRVRVGRAAGEWPSVQSAPANTEHPRVVVLEVDEGPRADLLHAAADLGSGTWVVGADSNRVGVRIDRAAGSSYPLLTHRENAGELRSEGVAHGSVQVPPSGRPVLFLPDHPVTGGYPVVAVLTDTAADLAAQLVPGSEIRFRRR
ncbi:MULTISPECIES: biotin-dependent carboxyltransferase family protein [Gordonia]|uniref:Biotin-dependent carboxyltransferase family protein n=1 Tax=Gordonia amicalis TaxID=89053 RepID=A0AAE4R1H9_9ACTN|nr:MULTISPECIES: biotin-dependent carboxyltransferase family protein [Gordonia]ATD69908.1 allophanate hydrolase [Gordonia sp. 1D]MCZ4651905.1 biotin-dependent carboxyltransferase family protein [Gordonia amicalis]MDJ0453955.1 biotin-dependent carboxyltransferase family protein [Gordonia amicalis]MDV6307027.1 biotin-dependent carboxyltransferase family protein [Gordonia amicalis]MDV6311618.1 biotin-dependent carboxyltransferase family protein [Gordonia amicalis]